MTATDCGYDAEGEIAANGFTRSGYVFEGWATEENGEVVYWSGEKVKIVNGGADITELLSVPVADGNGVVDLSKATVKEEIVREAMDIEKGAVIDLNSQGQAIEEPKTPLARIGSRVRLQIG